MSTYRVEWPCGCVTETEAWEPEKCPFCSPVVGADLSGRLSDVIAERDALRAELAAIRAQEHCAEIIDGWRIVFAGAGPIAPIVTKHGLKIGSRLYAAPPPQPSTAALVEALEACLEIEERPEVLEAARKALAEHREASSHD